MDFRLAIVVFTISVTCVLGDTSHLCDDIAQLDCRSYVQGDTDEKVCDNRNVLFPNFCEFSKAKCADDSITVVSLGKCFGSGPVEIYTTTGPTIPTPTLDPILSIFCQNKDTIDCPAEIAPVCASNGRLYINKCDFSLAYCDDTTLTLQDPDTCHH